MRILQLLFEKSTNLLSTLNTSHLSTDLVGHRWSSTQVLIQVVKQFPNHLHHCLLAGSRPIAWVITRGQVFAEVDATRKDDIKESVEGDDLLLHGVAAIINNDIEAPARLCDEVVQEDGVGLISRKDLGICDVRSPFLHACRVVLNIIHIYIGEELKPSFI